RDEQPRPGVVGRKRRQPAPGDGHHLGGDALRIAAAPRGCVTHDRAEVLEDPGEAGLGGLGLGVGVGHAATCHWTPKCYTRWRRDDDYAPSCATLAVMSAEVTAESVDIAAAD